MLKPVIYPKQLVLIVNHQFSSFHRARINMFKIINTFYNVINCLFLTCYRLCKTVGYTCISENIALSFIFKLRNKFKRDTLWHEAHWQFKNVLTPGIYKQAQLRGPTKHKILTCATRCLK